ncbi:hypothetical protein IJ556_06220 [bacterium]|nr:hypothetical protein [bacterium]MBR2274168.1 hypothetical protein [Alphaproteobacteria bacterium]
MDINLKKLFAFCILALLTAIPKADSFLLPLSAPIKYAENTANNRILPLVYIRPLEYYNHQTSSAQSKKISNYLALEPSIIITEDEKIADYYLVPKLLRSKLDPINDNHSRYSISVEIELWSAGGVLLLSEQQNRYIIIDKSQSLQTTARDLLQVLLKKTLDSLMVKIRNNQLIQS